ncbi:hypothetical protein JDV02_006873 [Purpureocillium takamizusanense]|uniref:Uncharacterized protein n=1 Tax=Purpureocillium takamizusanense TaxID=2060973 RepID=A0A9Q8QL59_9HYPO|nr:uncharacterized protein JDV02_006873 [Purpureocillium takamizusanense]UNI20821.1 hypothetical protein JDV02_006873 [Purpureocillium takamizusanense]
MASSTMAPSSAAGSSGSPPPPPSATTTAPRNIIGPLTSVYVPNLNCNSCTFTGTGSQPLNNDATAYWENCGVYFQDTLCRGRTPLPCMPHVTAYSDIAGASFFYSPGLHCPRSWRTVAMVSAADRKPDTTFLSRISLDTLLPDETVAICCYSDLEYFSNGHGAECVKTITSTSFEYNVCTTDELGTRTVPKTVTDIGHSIPYTYRQNTNKTITALFSHIFMYGPTIQLNWRPQDRLALDSRSISSSSSDRSTTSSVGPTDSGGNSSTPSGGSENVRPPLSQAAVAGIACGAALFVIGAGLLFFTLWFRRRKRRRQREGIGSSNEKPPLTPGGGGGFQKAELPSTSGMDAGRDRFHKPELEAPNRFEMDGAGAGAGLFELYGDEEFIPGELPAPAPATKGGGAVAAPSPVGPPPQSRPGRSRPATATVRRAGNNNNHPNTNTNKNSTSTDIDTHPSPARDHPVAAPAAAPAAAARPTLVHVQRKAVNPPARGTALRAHPPSSEAPRRAAAAGVARGGSPDYRPSIEGGWI